jgi:hypothetical protein
MHDAAMAAEITPTEIIGQYKHDIRRTRNRPDGRHDEHANHEGGSEKKFSHRSAEGFHAGSSSLRQNAVSSL